MKIVKSFKDTEFFQKRYNLSIENQSGDDFWEWGLGDDGELYYRCSEFIQHLRWCCKDYTTLNLTIRDMKRIVKEFGHLVVFT